MEIEEMQAIWNSQNDENLFVINETVLYAQIKRKSQAVNRKVELFEWLMIAVNFIVSIVLLVDVLMGTEQPYPFIFPGLYLAFSIYVAIRKFLRRSEEKPFPQTMLGELDKAISRINYLIHQNRSMMAWYFLPLFLAFAFISFFNAKLIWGLGLILILAPLSYFASRWEVNKFYLPKKKNLEALRKKLMELQEE